MVMWKLPFAKINIEKKGVYDFEKLYKDIKIWSDDTKFFFDENVLSRSKAGEGDEVTWKVTFVKRVDDYFLFRFVMTVYFFRQVEVIVKVSGEEIVMNKGFLHMQIDPHIEIDYMNHFKKKGVLQKVYENYIIGSKIGDRYGKFFGEIQGFVQAVRKSLGMNMGL